MSTAFKAERARWARIKGNKPLRDPAHLDFIRRQPCIVCRLEGRNPKGASEAAHTGVRGMRQKAADNEAIPLCQVHHRLGRDSHHQLGKRFFEHHGLDREKLVRHYQQLYERSRKA